MRGHQSINLTRTGGSLALSTYAGAALVWAAPVPTAFGQAPPVEFSLVPAADVQPSGPTYDYRIGRFEIRNDQFVAFLNDALANPENERGRFVYVDTVTGDVYVNTRPTGQRGGGSGGRTVKMFSPGTGGRIEYVNDAFSAVTTPIDYSDHPVVGVSWHGAVKYCNWLTIGSGLPASERAYVEDVAASADHWRPVTIAASAWTTRDLDADERAALIEKLGFRMPMDDGNAVAAPYDEWYKAAAWDPLAAVNRTYGFGRDAVTGADANYLDSGDPFDNGPAPVGYYDGTDHGGAFATNPLGNQNGYDLFDLSGNVWEWMQDQSPINAIQRRNRGGSWRSLAVSLDTSVVAARTATSLDDATGFRVVQRVIEDVVVTPFDELIAAGPWGGPYDVPGSDALSYSLSNVIDQDVAYTVTSDANWISITSGTGLIPRGGQADVSVVVDPTCSDGLVVGLNTATVIVSDALAPVLATRSVQLTVREPLSAMPATGFSSRMLFAGPPDPPNTLYTLSSASDRTVNWSASWTETGSTPSGLSWLTLNGSAATSGIVPPHGIWPIVVTINAVEAARLTAGVHTADVVVVDDCTSTRFVKTVTLTVDAPISVAPTDAVTFAGAFGGPFNPTFHVFTVTGAVAGSVIWTTEVCTEAPGSVTCTAATTPTWLSLDATGGTIEGSGTAQVTASLTPTAATLEAGSYSLTIRFTEPVTGFVLDRPVTLEVSGLGVEPLDDAEFRGPLAGPFAPSSFVYRVRNHQLPELSWSTSITFDPPVDQLGDLVWLNVTPSFGIVLDPNDFSEATVAPTVDAALLASGTYRATIGFTANGATASRQITLVVGSESFAVPMVKVPGDQVQPGGPTHDFRIGRFEITNAEYARFLNSALANVRFGPADARSEHLYFDIDSGDVYLNPSQAGEEGTAAPSAMIPTLIFRPTVGAAISYLSDGYVVKTGLDRFPVVGASWYGALKFCNWMTILQGMDVAQRAYREAATAADWGPIGTPAELLELRGFRLPMDDGHAAASPLNEWFKAAAWENTLGTNATYGFGRNTLNPVDANFRASGDPHEPGLSPVGFFDGANVVADGVSTTTDTANGYGLYDMTGNAAEWVQNVGVSASERATRGGHFDNVLVSTLLRNDGRGSLPATSALGFVGFRVAQAIEPVELMLTQAPDEPGRIGGFVGGPFDPASLTLVVTNAGAQTVDDLTIDVAPGWLEVVGVAPTHVPPGVPVNIPLRVSAQAIDAGVSPPPPGAFALVPASDDQPGGPAYNYWIGRTEVTNLQFTVFLDDALFDARVETPGVRSDYLYFDTTTGDVYINDAQTAAEGAGPPPFSPATLIYDAGLGRVKLVNGTYRPEVGFDQHPVVGVSWYGTLKYCNWLTIVEGIPAALRAYREAPATKLAGWHPVVVDDATWIAEGLDGVDASGRSARVLLIQDTLGYRLPMDDGAGGASPFNEWHKAASRGPDDERAQPVFDFPFGFGRSTVTPADANYACSDDPFEDALDCSFGGTTPVRFYDGVNTLASKAVTDCSGVEPSGAETVATGNGYGLHGATGNVAEWTQDFGTGFADRATRGGSWRDDAASAALTTTDRRPRPPETASDDLGFRVVRGTGHVVTVTVADALGGSAHKRDFVLDLREPFTLDPSTGLSHQGLYGDSFAVVPELAGAYTLSNRSASDMAWSASADRNWIDLVERVDAASSGDLTGGTSLTFDVSANDGANALGPGEHTAELTFTDTTTGLSIKRDVQLTIDQPVEVTTDPAVLPLAGTWGLPLDTLAPQTLSLTNLTVIDLEYSVATDQTWLTLAAVDPQRALSGRLSAGETRQFTATVNAGAASLAVGDFDADVRFAFTDSRNGVSGSVSQTVSLSIEDPIAITQTDDPWNVGPGLDAASLPSQVYTLTNNGDRPIEFIAGADVNWLDVVPEAVEILPGQQRTVNVTLNNAAPALFDGVYVASLTIEDTLSLDVQCRTIVLTINENLSVDPFATFVTAGISGGAITPAINVYTLTNVARDHGGPIDWRASVATPGADWMVINGGAPASGTLQDGDSVNVLVTLDAAATAGLVGDQTAEIEFTDLTNGEATRRSISLALVVPKFALSEDLVPGATAQPSGPSYTFQMAETHVTNEQFVAFLNDAMANLTNERGHYMFFDSTTGDVYLNDARTGAVGDATGLRTAKVFSPSDSGRIVFIAGAYEVLTAPVDYTTHPVTGVSWYGALKFCNWLTLDRGMLPSEQCYVEDTDANPGAWRPVTITAADWSLRDLNDPERKTLVTDFRGFRLPMDDGFGNTDPSTDAADAYNEWYKAAAWDAAARVNHVYGFGRDTLSGADANFRCSGDPFDGAICDTDGGTTPVGYYDGTTKGAAFPTAAGANPFGLQDMTGDVYHWIQGRFSDATGSIGFRTVRSGAWRTPIGSALLTAKGRSFTAPTRTRSYIGFRVVRTPPTGTGDFDGNGVIDARDLTVAVACLTGPGSTIDATCVTFDTVADGVVDLRDLASMFLSFTSP